MSDSVLKWIDEESAKASIADVRSDKSDTDWTVISYEGKTGPSSQKLKLLASGTGGIEALSEHLTDDIIAFALLRESDVFDESVTVKFVFINWIGESSPRMQKSRVSIHLGPIREWFGQFHVDFNATSQSEITKETIKSKIMDTSGSGSRVLSNTGKTHLTEQAQTSKTLSTKRGTVSNKDDLLTFVDEEDAIQRIRSFRKSETENWILYSYEESSTNRVAFLASGTGSVSELKDHLKDDIVCYGLVRKIDRIDESDTIKFCFVQWIGENINRLLRARLGTHKGAVSAFFTPFHVDLIASDFNEIDDSIIQRLIQINSGTESRVLSDDKLVPSEKVIATKKVSNAPTHEPSISNDNTSNDEEVVSTNTNTSYVRSGGNTKNVKPIQKLVSSDTIELDFEDEEAVLNSIASVRSSDDGINWTLVTYNAPSKSKTLKLVSTGTGGIEEFIENLQDDIVGYGLVRLIEQIDQSETVKFCFVNWVGDNIHRMQRAVLSTHKGFVRNLFSPFHVDHECNRKDEISEEIIMAKIKKASGTANFVLN